MPVNIRGKSYVTVAERLTKAHQELDKIDITTEVLIHDPVVIKATVVTKKGTFTGISAANANKQIEKETPYEVAESSAVGRALAFAGYETTDGIASAEEMRKVSSPSPATATKPVNAIDDGLTANCRVHGDPMVQKISERTGNYYWSHRMPNGDICFGK